MDRLKPYWSHSSLCWQNTAHFAYWQPVSWTKKLHYPSIEILLWYPGFPIRILKKGIKLDHDLASCLYTCTYRPLHTNITIAVPITENIEEAIPLTIPVCVTIVCKLKKTWLRIQLFMFLCLHCVAATKEWGWSKITGLRVEGNSISIL